VPARGGRRTPGDAIPAVTAAPVVEEDPASLWCDGKEVEGFAPDVWASDLRMALLAWRCKDPWPWPFAAGLYSPRDPPWPEVDPTVGKLIDSELSDIDFVYGGKCKADTDAPSISFMRRATQVGGVRRH
jgi:hypothetical protein